MAGIPVNAIDIMQGHRLAPHSGETLSPIAGWHHDREPWVSKSPTGQDVVGVRFVMGRWNGKPLFRTLDPLYDRVDAGQNNVVVAKPGYVVGGILVDSDEQEHAIRLIFMKSRAGRLLSHDAYLSDWIGTPVTGTPPKLIGSHGEHVIGLCGYRGLNLDGVGLVLVMP